MKSRLYYSVVCFILAVSLLMLGVPITMRKSYPKIQAVRTTEPVTKGQQFNRKNVEIVEIGAIHIPDTVICSIDDVIGRFAALDMVEADLVYTTKISPIPILENSRNILLPEKNVSYLVKIKMIEGGEIDTPDTGDVIKMNSFHSKLIDIPALQFVRVLSTVEADDEDVLTITISVNEKQKAYLEKYRNDIFYASVMVRGNDELAEKLLAEQDEYFEEAEDG